MFLRCFVETDKLVLNYYELYMLAVLNGCQGHIIITETDWHALNAHNNWEEEIGIAVNSEDDIDDGGSEMHYPFE
jgi:hypothetical protein